MQPSLSAAARVETRGPGHLMVCGELSFATVPELLERGNGLLQGQDGSAVIDLGEVTRSDSAGLALLVAWMREARGRGLTLSFRNVTPQLQAMAEVSGVDRLLGLAR